MRSMRWPPRVPSVLRISFGMSFSLMSPARMPGADRFGEDFVEAVGLGERASELRHFEHVCEARAVVIALRREKGLRVVLEAAECLAMNDAVAVALIRRAEIDFRLMFIPP